ncbi:U32 family peptidase [Bacteriovorax sp. Seq25_V]|uniref:U32 family peptidase n=1 Tax=Bacteriovorax sp. Seq25_V TaxID=1201288 RepID=UPI00038A511A|nr:U32 family peptidase [Bacteriovorax sp. Seq25_V]EQC44879.1 peptidase, U32 family [Bacteriovorax sp. Seq25_V]
MKLVSYVNSFEDIKILKDAGYNEAILAPSLLSKIGTLKIDELNSLATKLNEEGIRPILEWDILMTETDFNMVKSHIGRIDFKNFTAIRIQDPGAVSYVQDNFPTIDIQLILESGAYHNYRSIEVWKKLLGERLKRVILSLELNKETIKEYIEKLGLEIEFLGVGRILLFYTPRKLVTPLFEEEKREYYQVNEIPVEVSASSEESAHKGFPVIENVHGTFMFNTKDHFILEYIDELKDIGLDFLRIDIRHIEDKSILKDVASLNDKFDSDFVQKVKDSYPGTVIRGFFHVNKSDVLFKKLKNQRIVRQDDNFVGEVIDVNKKNYIALIIKGRDVTLKLGDELSLLTPDGREKKVKINFLRNSQLLDIESAKSGDIVLIPHVSAISVKTMVYKLLT